MKECWCLFLFAACMWCLREGSGEPVNRHEGGQGIEKEDPYMGRKAGELGKKDARI